MLMPRSSTFADAFNVTPSHPARLGTRGVRVLPIAAFVAASVLTVFFAGGATANGQTPLSPLPAQGPLQPTGSADSSAAATTTGGSSTNADSNSSTNAGSNSSPSNSSTNAG